ncbi:hypothetical protein HAX54_016407 [Datura stramonium]|uniref:Uncharacterized protein n=1 Tax=Datura stramonium TaxID=4076 RepID=A0ABS8UIR9_DATST|nr:hypothetical protein [Datura stramonium]
MGKCFSKQDILPPSPLPTIPDVYQYEKAAIDAANMKQAVACQSCKDVGSYSREHLRLATDMSVLTWQLAPSGLARTVQSSSFTLA